MPKPVEWVGSSRADLRAFPEEVRRVMGIAINDAQNGEEHPSVKALKGFGGRSVLEVVDDFDGDTYRAVYTVRFAAAVYVLHCFQKKSKKVEGLSQARYRGAEIALESGRSSLSGELWKGRCPWLTTIRQ
jgi:phage-related protein